MAVGIIKFGVATPSSLLALQTFAAIIVVLLLLFFSLRATAAPTAVAPVPPVVKAPAGTPRGRAASAAKESPDKSTKTSTRGRPRSRTPSKKGN